MKDPFQNIEIDRDSLVLGLLNYCLTYRLESENQALVEAALKRIYPGAHNVGHIDCLICLDMGVVCSCCERFPHAVGCQQIKGIPQLRACEAVECEASANADRLLKDQKIIDLNDKVMDLERQLKEAKAKLGKLGR